MAGMVDGWRQRAGQLKAWLYALYLAYRHPAVPWHARLFALLVVGYAFSPIDLVPDFIPVLGYLDDLVLVPLGVALALKMIPRPVLEECWEQAQAMMAQPRPRNWIAATIILGLWLLLLALAVSIVAPVLGL